MRPPPPSSRERRELIPAVAISTMRRHAGRWPSVVIPSITLLVVALSGVAGCEQRFSSDPPLVPEGPAPGPSSSSAIDALFAPIADAGATTSDSSRAMSIVSCWTNASGCREGDASAGGTYRVVFGSGRGEIRSRSQAMADLYEELRNRTTAGDRLVAEVRAPGDAGATPAPGAGKATTTTASSSGDPISRCAFRFLDRVDEIGEVDIYVDHRSGPGGCSVLLRRSDTGSSECLVQPEQSPRSGRTGR